MSEPTALIADFGGVLTSSVLDSFNRWCAGNDVEFGELLQALTASHDGSAESSPLHLIEIGEIDEAEFSARVSANLSSSGKEIEGSGLKEALFADVRPEPSMVEVIARLRRGGVATCLLSNSWGKGSDYPHEVLETLFDEMIFSGEVGLRKPDSEIYLMAAKKIKKKPSECVFVDDLKVNVKGARSVGMNGLLHSDAGATVSKLEDLFSWALAGMS